MFHENITLLLNCSCLDAEMDGNRIVSVTGWQLTTYTYHTVKAVLFADCSGDGILAPLTGAEHRIGREARNEFGESHAPETADQKTMGMTCLFHAREYDTPQPFKPLPWAHTFKTCDELPYGAKGHKWWKMGYWWVELGGEYDSIHDTEYLRDELLKITWGVWDHIKNHCEGQAENWAVDWIQFLPAKRESVRYIGDHVLNQNDVEAEGKFDDLVAYGGWSMDDHHPAGFWSVKLDAPSTIFHEAPYPYGIPYRSLYSKNIENLFCGGRCHSATHMAMSSTRVAGTGMSMAYAQGIAADMCVQKGINPRSVLEHIHELQQALLRDDAYLPWVEQELSSLVKDGQLAASQGDPEPVRDGINRQVGDDPHCWEHKEGDMISYEFDSSRTVESATLILDSAMDKYIQMSYHHKKCDECYKIPDVIPEAFKIEVKKSGSWELLEQITGNYQRLVRIPVQKECEGVRYALNKTRGAETTRMYGFYLE
jgi:hypothetical protein